MTTVPCRWTKIHWKIRCWHTISKQCRWFNPNKQTHVFPQHLVCFFRWRSFPPGSPSWALRLCSVPRPASPYGAIRQRMGAGCGRWRCGRRRDGCQSWRSRDPCSWCCRNGSWKLWLKKNGGEFFFFFGGGYGMSEMWSWYFLEMQWEFRRRVSLVRSNLDVPWMALKWANLHIQPLQHPFELCWFLGWILVDSYVVF